jgi:hypothetical protein
MLCYIMPCHVLAAANLTYGDACLSFGSRSQITPAPIGLAGDCWGVFEATIAGGGAFGAYSRILWAFKRPILEYWRNGSLAVDCRKQPSSVGCACTCVVCACMHSVCWHMQL